MLSYAIAAGIIRDDSEDCDDFHAYSYVTNKTFGDGTHNGMFSFGNSFISYCNDMDIDLDTTCKSGEVADLLEKLIFKTSHDDIKHVIVTWKNNTKDIFSDMDMVTKFFELNPSRKASCKNVTMVKLVERVVYDEIEEVVDDWK
jgi:uncharacterized protein involved in tellurium resistance